MQERQTGYPSSGVLTSVSWGLTLPFEDEQREAQEAPATRVAEAGLVLGRLARPTYETAPPVLGQQHAVRAGAGELG